jgi:type II restriction enzyme
MSLTEEQKRKIEEIIERSLLEKLKRYKPETFSMPFHYRLLGRDRMALYSFIQSLNTTFKEEEIEKIRKVAKEGKAIEVKPFRVDLFLKDKNGSVHLFDLKTAKPNIEEFKNYKRTLLEWVAIYLWKEPSANINSYIAIPYNPYEPEPYQRWTMRGIIDIERELKVAEEFWDFLGEDGSYEELLNCYERVGIKLRPVLDRYFSKFRS